MFKRIYAWFKRPNKSTIEQYIETFIIILPIAFVVRTWFYGLYVVPTGSMETTMLVGERFFADKLTVQFSGPKHGDIISFNDPNFPYAQNAAHRIFQRYVWGPSNWTKRVIGVPGDHVTGVIEQGQPVIYLNGKKLEERYVNKYPLLAVYREGEMPPWNFRSWDQSVSYQDQPFYVMEPFNVLKAARLLRTYSEEPIRQPHKPSFDSSGRNIDEYDIVLKKDEYWVLGDNRRGSLDSRFWGPLNSELIHGKIIFRLISIDSNDPWIVFDLLTHPIEFWRRVRWYRFFQRVC